MSFQLTEKTISRAAGYITISAKYQQSYLILRMHEDLLPDLMDQADMQGLNVTDDLARFKFAQPYFQRKLERNEFDSGATKYITLRQSDLWLESAH